MNFEKQIEEILKRRVQNLIASDLISPLFWEDFAKEIAQIAYPGEFVEWLFTNKDFEHTGIFFDDGELIMFTRKQGLKEYILPELYEFWTDNVEGK